VIFLVSTGEEKGLLGADFFARHPAVPVEKIVGNVDLDMPVLLYPFTDLVAFGADHSTLGKIVANSGKAMQLSLSPDPMPTENIFVRSDHYMFVKQGVPAVFLATGYANGGAAQWGQFMKTTYHKPGDDLSQPINWRAGARFAEANWRITSAMADRTRRRCGTRVTSSATSSRPRPRAPTASKPSRRGAVRRAPSGERHAKENRREHYRSPAGFSFQLVRRHQHFTNLPLASLQGPFFLAGAAAGSALAMGFIAGRRSSRARPSWREPPSSRAQPWQHRRAWRRACRTWRTGPWHCGRWPLRPWRERREQQAKPEAKSVSSCHPSSRDKSRQARKRSADGKLLRGDRTVNEQPHHHKNLRGRNYRSALETLALQRRGSAK
jgi:hypothetical protein